MEENLGKILQEFSFKTMLVGEVANRPTVGTVFKFHEQRETIYKGAPETK